MKCRKVRHAETYIDRSGCVPVRRVKTRIVTDACGNRKRVLVYRYDFETNVRKSI